MAASKRIGSLHVSLSSNTQKFSKGLNSAEKRLGTFGRTVKASAAKLGSISPTFGALGKGLGSIVSMANPATAALGGIAVAAAGLGTAFVAAKRAIGKTFDQFERIDAISKTSDKLGIATENLVGLQYAAQMTGVSSQTLDMALQRMVRRVSEAARGTGEAKDAIKELGLDAGRLSAMSPDAAFSTLADAMGRVEGQGNKVRLAMKLFDSEGVALVNTLGLGRQGLADAQKEAERFGLTFQREAGGGIGQAIDSLTRFDALLTGTFRTLATTVGPSVSAALNTITGSTGDVHTAIGELQSGIEDFAANGIAFFQQLTLEIARFGKIAIKVGQASGWIVDMAKSVSGAKANEMGYNMAVSMFGDEKAKAAGGGIDLEGIFDSVIGSASGSDWSTTFKTNLDKAHKLAKDAADKAAKNNGGGLIPALSTPTANIGLTTGKATSGAFGVLGSIGGMVKNTVGNADFLRKAVPWEHLAKRAIGGGAIKSTAVEEAVKETTRPSGQAVSAAAFGSSGFASVLASIRNQNSDPKLKEQQKATRVLQRIERNTKPQSGEALGLAGV